MKKIILLAVITGSVLIFAATGLAQSEQPQKGKMEHMGQMKQMMEQKMKKQDNKQTRCPICAKAMASMMGKAMLPTDDGGVIVMIANKLYKYDKNLALINETELSVDFQNMQKMMREMHNMDLMGDSQSGAETQSESQQ